MIKKLSINNLYENLQKKQKKKSPRGRLIYYLLRLNDVIIDHGFFRDHIALFCISKLEEISTPHNAMKT